MEAFCRSLVTTYRHYHGGCVVGKVVDGDFRVMGINSLRVVDGSTFNMSSGTNPQSTLIMLGRKVNFLTYNNITVIWFRKFLTNLFTGFDL